MKPQFLPGMFPCLPVEFRNDHARLGNHPTWGNMLDLVHIREVEHNTARQRHCLTIIPRACAARRNRHTMRIGHAQHLNDFGFTNRRDNKISHNIIKLGFQDGRIPIEIPGLLFDQRWIVFEGDPIEFLLDCLIIGHVMFP